MSLSLVDLLGPEHEPFLWPGSRNLALLIHGFPSSPAEMRRLGAIVHEAGWSVQGLRLPGFGRELPTLAQRRAEEWRDAVLAAAKTARRDYDRVLLVGNSMGGALALQAAAQVEVDGLLLFCPFWRVNSRLLDAAYPLVQPMLCELRPLRGARFDHPTLREGILRFLPDADLDNADVQAALRTLSLYTSVLGEVRGAGQMGYTALPYVTAPVLIIQGTQDPLAHPTLTRRMAARVANLAGYVEVDSGHELAHLRNEPERAVGEIIRTFLLQIVTRPAPVRVNTRSLPANE